MKNIRAIVTSLSSILMLLLLVPMPGHGAAPVEELGGQVKKAGSSNHSVGNPAVDNGSASNDPYYRTQLLMEELRQLRGLLEEQSNELSLLKKRQREDYLDLDRRLSAVASGSLASAPLADTGAVPGSERGSTASARQSNEVESAGRELANGQFNSGNTSQAGQNELRQKVAYDQAYGLLKARQIDKAKAALKQFLLDYPQGPYTANAHYWLGEVYLLGSELPEAATEFSAVVQKYPGHRKVNDATFKLGKVYHLQNQLDKSRILLERVAKGSDSAARLAQDYLLRNF
ncbi:MAG: tetratricopeptide repeat protein [Porticoccaceae bacterium]|nr:tetratricopeptide repeat protein [Porticoccaceae bacterium]